MRGILHLLIVKRKQTDSQKYKDKWLQEDKVRLITSSYNNVKIYKIISINKNLGEFIILRDETAFIKFIHSNYGSGDYCIRCWIKGKEKNPDGWGHKFIGKSGIRTFWDGIISSDRIFYRRKSTGYLKENPSIMEKTSYADSEQRISDYFKTKIPGRWYNF